jgi:hypothetical protein
MAEQVKVLAQTNPGAATLTPSLTVGAATSVIVSSIFVANRSSSATSFRISVAPAGAGDSDEQYIYYDIPIQGNDTFASTTGISLETTDVIRVYAAAATLSFNIHGVEIT